MKNLAKIMLLGVVAWLFNACATPMVHKGALIFETEPSRATIICDGKELGKSPINYSTITDKAVWLDESNLKEIQEKFGGNFSLPKCKARWASGYEDYFATTANLGEFKFIDNLGQNVKFYTLTKRLIRPKSKGYKADVAYADIHYPDFKLATNPAGAQIICEGGKPSFISVEDNLKNGVVKMTKCKAVFISGYEQNFRHTINIDQEDITTLTHQTINRPNTKGYADDIRWALELEKKQIIEANERARTRVLQEQAAAQQRAAAAAEAQARAAEQQAQEAARQRALDDSWSWQRTMQQTTQQFNEFQRS